MFDSGHGSGQVLVGWLIISIGLRGHRPGFYPLRGGYYLVPDAPQIRGMLTGPKVFLVLPNTCGLRPCDRTLLKNGLVPYFSGGRTENKYQVLPSLTLWHSDWRSTPFYLCCIILSLIYFVPHKPEFLSFFRTLYWSTTVMGWKTCNKYNDNNLISCLCMAENYQNFYRMVSKKHTFTDRLTSKSQKVKDHKHRDHAAEIPAMLGWTCLQN